MVGHIGSCTPPACTQDAKPSVVKEGIQEATIKPKCILKELEHCRLYSFHVYVTEAAVRKSLGISAEDWDRH